MTINGNAVTSGACLNEDDEVEINITPAEDQVPTATLNGSTIELTESEDIYTGNFAMPGQASTLVINTIYLSNTLLNSSTLILMGSTMNSGRL